MATITPLGGTLINRIATGTRLEALKAEARGLPTLKLGEREQCDLELIAVGAFSPLTGFMGSADFQSVCNSMKLAGSGLPWSIPITCCTDEKTAAALKVGQRIALTDDDGRILAILTLEETYAHDKTLECETVYRTREEAHPGVKVTLGQGDACLAGPVEVICPTYRAEFGDFRRTPAQLREEFDRRGWKTVVAFQTRNPIHRAHEYLTKCALEMCDGLLVHPLVGQTQPGDIPPDVRMACYQVLLSKYYQPSRTLLAVLPAAMRYAGPREAILHAIMRRNYGCTHFIVGRDHAGVGTYYGTYDAQKIFDSIDGSEERGVGIVPLKFEHTVWCRTCEGMVSSKTCPHGSDAHVTLSGTKVRELLAAGERPPMEFSRPEVADVLISSMRKG